MNWAKLAYEAYGDCVGWVNFRSEPMPPFEELPVAIQNGWEAAAMKVISEYDV